MEAKELRVELAAGIVTAYLSHNPLSVEDLPDLIRQICAALTSAADSAGSPAETPSEPQQPAVSIKRSVTPDHITCLEDRKTVRVPEATSSDGPRPVAGGISRQWELPKDYPIVARTYSEARSAMTRDIGLGQKGKRLRLNSRFPSTGIISGGPSGETGRRRLGGLDTAGVACRLSFPLVYHFERPDGQDLFQSGTCDKIQRLRVCWRRGWDSNPRDGSTPPTPLAGERLRPLGHLSVGPGYRNSLPFSTRMVWC